ncbi:MAG: phage protein Gp27 family protein [Gammaproteobacteria bacterium]
MKVPRLKRFNPRVQEEIESRLLEGDFTSYRALAAELNRRGCHIEKSALHAHRQRLLAARSQSKTTRRG